MVSGLAMLMAAVDQLIKWQLVRHFFLGESAVLVPRLLDLTYRQNPHAAFSLLQSLPPAALLAITLVVLVLFSVLIWPYLRTRGGIAAAGLVYGGALGNLIDRIRLHYVIDYLDFHVWPVFNLADASVVVGIGVLMLCIIRTDHARQHSTGGQPRETHPA